MFGRSLPYLFLSLFAFGAQPSATLGQAPTPPDHGSRPRTEEGDKRDSNVEIISCGDTGKYFPASAKIGSLRPSREQRQEFTHAWGQAWMERDRKKHPILPDKKLDEMANCLLMLDLKTFREYEQEILAAAPQGFSHPAGTATQPFPWNNSEWHTFRTILLEFVIRPRINKDPMNFSRQLTGAIANEVFFPKPVLEERQKKTAAELALLDLTLNYRKSTLTPAELRAANDRARREGVTPEIPEEKLKDLHAQLSKELQALNRRLKFSPPASAPNTAAELIQLYYSDPKSFHRTVHAFSPDKVQHFLSLITQDGSRPPEATPVYWSLRRFSPFSAAKTDFPIGMEKELFTPSQTDAIDRYGELTPVERKTWLQSLDHHEFSKLQGNLKHATRYGYPMIHFNRWRVHRSLILNDMQVVGSKPPETVKTSAPPPNLEITEQGLCVAPEAPFPVGSNETETLEKLERLRDALAIGLAKGYASLDKLDASPLKKSDAERELKSCQARFNKLLEVLKQKNAKALFPFVENPVFGEDFIGLFYHDPEAFVRAMKQLPEQERHWVGQQVNRIGWADQKGFTLDQRLKAVPVNHFILEIFLNNKPLLESFNAKDNLERRRTATHDRHEKYRHAFEQSTGTLAERREKALAAVSAQDRELMHIERIWDLMRSTNPPSPGDDYPSFRWHRSAKDDNLANPRSRALFVDTLATESTPRLKRYLSELQSALRNQRYHYESGDDEYLTSLEIAVATVESWLKVVAPESPHRLILQRIARGEEVSNELLQLSDSQRGEWARLLYFAERLYEGEGKRFGIESEGKLTAERLREIRTRLVMSLPPPEIRAQSALWWKDDATLEKELDEMVADPNFRQRYEALIETTGLLADSHLPIGFEDPAFIHRPLERLRARPGFKETVDLTAKPVAIPLAKSEHSHAIAKVASAIEGAKTCREVEKALENLPSKLVRDSLISACHAGGEWAEIRSRVLNKLRADYKAAAHAKLERAGYHQYYVDPKRRTEGEMFVPGKDIRIPLSAWAENFVSPRAEGVDHALVLLATMSPGWKGRDFKETLELWVGKAKKEEELREAHPEVSERVNRLDKILPSFLNRDQRLMLLALPTTDLNRLLDVAEGIRYDSPHTFLDIIQKVTRSTSDPERQRLISESQAKYGEVPAPPPPHADEKQKSAYRERIAIATKELESTHDIRTFLHRYKELYKHATGRDLATTLFTRAGTLSARMEKDGEIGSAFSLEEQDTMKDLKADVARHLRSSQPPRSEAVTLTNADLMNASCFNPINSDPHNGHATKGVRWITEEQKTRGGVLLLLTGGDGHWSSDQKRFELGLIGSEIFNELRSSSVPVKQAYQVEVSRMATPSFGTYRGETVITKTAYRLIEPRLHREDFLSSLRLKQFIIALQNSPFLATENRTAKEAWFKCVRQRGIEELLKFASDHSLSRGLWSETRFESCEALAKDLQKMSNPNACDGLYNYVEHIAALIRNKDRAASLLDPKSPEFLTLQTLFSEGSLSERRLEHLVGPEHARKLRSLITEAYSGYIPGKNEENEILVAKDESGASRITVTKAFPTLKWNELVKAVNEAEPKGSWDTYVGLRPESRMIIQSNDDLKKYIQRLALEADKGFGITSSVADFSNASLEERDEWRKILEEDLKKLRENRQDFQLVGDLGREAKKRLLYALADSVISALHTTHQELAFSPPVVNTEEVVFGQMAHRHADRLIRRDHLRSIYPTRKESADKLKSQLTTMKIPLSPASEIELLKLGKPQLQWLSDALQAAHEGAQPDVLQQVKDLVHNLSYDRLMSEQKGMYSLSARLGTGTLWKKVAEILRADLQRDLEDSRKKKCATEPPGEHLSSPASPDNFSLIERIEQTKGPYRERLYWWIADRISDRCLEWDHNDPQRLYSPKMRELSEEAREAYALLVNYLEESGRSPEERRLARNYLRGNTDQKSSGRGSILVENPDYALNDLLSVARARELADRTKREKVDSMLTYVNANFNTGVKVIKGLEYRGADDTVMSVPSQQRKILYGADAHSIDALLYLKDVLEKSTSGLHSASRKQALEDWKEVIQVPTYKNILALIKKYNPSMAGVAQEIDDEIRMKRYQEDLDAIVRAIALEKGGKALVDGLGSGLPLTSALDRVDFSRVQNPLSSAPHSLLTAFANGGIFAPGVPIPAVPAQAPLTFAEFLAQKRAMREGTHPSLDPAKFQSPRAPRPENVLHTLLPGNALGAVTASIGLERPARQKEEEQFLGFAAILASHPTLQSYLKGRENYQLLEELDQLMQPNSDIRCHGLEQPHALCPLKPFLEKAAPTAEMLEALLSHFKQNRVEQRSQQILDEATDQFFKESHIWAALQEERQRGQLSLSPEKRLALVEQYKALNPYRLDEVPNERVEKFIDEEIARRVPRMVLEQAKIGKCFDEKFPKSSSCRAAGPELEKMKQLEQEVRKLLHEKSDRTQLFNSRIASFRHRQAVTLNRIENYKNSLATSKIHDREEKIKGAEAEFKQREETFNLLDAEVQGIETFLNKTVQDTINSNTLAILQALNGLLTASDANRDRVRTEVEVALGHYKTAIENLKTGSQGVKDAGVGADIVGAFRALLDTNFQLEERRIAIWKIAIEEFECQRGQVKKAVDTCWEQLLSQPMSKEMLRAYKSDPKAVDALRQAYDGAVRGYTHRENALTQQAEALGTFELDNPLVRQAKERALELLTHDLYGSKKSHAEASEWLSQETRKVAEKRESANLAIEGLLSSLNQSTTIDDVKLPGLGIKLVPDATGKLTIDLTDAQLWLLNEVEPDHPVEQHPLFAVDRCQAIGDDHEKIKKYLREDKARARAQQKRLKKLKEDLTALSQYTSGGNLNDVIREQILGAWAAQRWPHTTFMYYPPTIQATIDPQKREEAASSSRSGVMVSYDGNSGAGPGRLIINSVDRDRKSKELSCLYEWSFRKGSEMALKADRDGSFLLGTLPALWDTVGGTRVEEINGQPVEIKRSDEKANEKMAERAKLGRAIDAIWQGGAIPLSSPYSVSSEEGFYELFGIRGAIDSAMDRAAANAIQHVTAIERELWWALLTAGMGTALKGVASATVHGLKLPGYLQKVHAGLTTLHAANLTAMKSALTMGGMLAAGDAAVGQATYWIGRQRELDELKKSGARQNERGQWVDAEGKAVTLSPFLDANRNGILDHEEFGGGYRDPLWHAANMLNFENFADTVEHMWMTQLIAAGANPLLHKLPLRVSKPMLEFFGTVPSALTSAAIQEVIDPIDGGVDRLWDPEVQDRLRFKAITTSVLLNPVDYLAASTFAKSPLGKLVWAQGVNSMGSFAVGAWSYEKYGPQPLQGGYVPRNAWEAGRLTAFSGSPADAKVSLAARTQSLDTGRNRRLASGADTLSQHLPDPSAVRARAQLAQVQVVKDPNAHSGGLPALRDEIRADLKTLRDTDAKADALIAEIRIGDLKSTGPGGTFGIKLDPSGKPTLLSETRDLLDQLAASKGLDPSGLRDFVEQKLAERQGPFSRQQFFGDLVKEYAEQEAKTKGQAFKDGKPFAGAPLTFAQMVTDPRLISEIRLEGLKPQTNVEHQKLVQYLGSRWGLNDAWLNQRQVTWDTIYRNLETAEANVLGQNSAWRQTPTLEIAIRREMNTHHLPFIP